MEPTKVEKYFEAAMLAEKAFVQVTASAEGNFLLAHYDAESSAPAFREADANDFQIG